MSSSQVNVPYQEEGTMKLANPWLIAAREQLMDTNLRPLETYDISGYKFMVKCSADSVWVVAHWPKGGGCAFRVAHCAGAKLSVNRSNKREQALELSLDSAMGPLKVTIEFLNKDQPLLHWTTNLLSPYPMFFSCMPRDVYPLDEKDDPMGTKGAVYSKQEGPKAGVLYLTINEPKTGSLVYMQNLTKLNDYFAKTHSAPYGVVQGQWPELGFSLPNDGKTPLPANSETTISDAFVLLSEIIPSDQYEAAQLYLDMLVPIYLNMERPETAYHDYISKAKQAIKDLESEKCVMPIKGLKYLRPYVEAEDKPPESMVQLAVLTPLTEYEAWHEEKIPFIENLRKTIKQFYVPDLRTIVRYLPGQEFTGQNQEAQEDPSTMDSWYLFHPLLNLARLAKKGSEEAKKLFFDSLDYAISGAHHFDYKWPVFYDMKTLEAKQAVEGSPSSEPDVACIYALVMVQAYELSKEERYLREAEAAAKSIDNLGFNLPYQMNVTSFGASAFWRLYKITGDTSYKKLVTVCISNIIANSWIWECEYGYAKNYRTFFGIAPLAKMMENSYLASYEEMEVLSAFDDLAQNAGMEDLSPSIWLFMSEFSRYILDRCWSYFPSEIPSDMIAEKAKTGKVDPKLALPVEDLREGWKKAGQIGQEVYGAGGTLITITRHYNHKKDWPFIVYCEYPTADYKLNQKEERHSLEFRVYGDSRFNCELRILPFKDKSIPSVTLSGPKGVLDGKTTKEEHQQYTVVGGADYTISWKRPS